MQRRDYRLTLDGLGFHVTEWGEPEAWPVLMLHGIRGYAETFVGVADALQPGCRVIAFDQRGRGESDWDPRHNYYTDTYVADVEALVARLDLPRFDLLGHSMGGINAIAYAARHPGKVRRLVIEDAGPGAFEASDGAIRIRKELASTPIAFASWDEAAAFMRALRPTVTEEARQQRLESMLKPLGGGGFTWRYDHAGIAATRLNPAPARQVDLVACVSALQCETLVVRGGRSDYLQPPMARHMRTLNPRITTLEIPDAGHYVHDDQPALFAEAVTAFLKRPEAAADPANP
ncbi:pimeloyl-ACP methyl ester carboxylesterase [Variovorax boronicumulans]|uniref:Pimeloyl-ACP methyl ester carboxylesterase n=1 Tax=Variovorax boronicumulans TaxID=436515 RepID=A0AAW8D543_9BURK|nr:alpha/beta hydrolase [Variovorax boronicumulans]MDP9894941.1 pimeloyl-ACP methyl ester carboxylesterase [Variovorax boronicumulans]MDQ0054739.1 pimeloyl-ACP methyl ester carboxylesterase [Variovorax boronicumulans]